MEGIVLGVVFAVVAACSLTDVRTKEVPDWLTYGLAIFGLGAGLLRSVAEWSLQPVAFSLAGAVLLFGISYALYRMGQWGGGDGKLLIGIGASLGLPVMLEFPYIGSDSFLVSFLANLVVVTALYSILLAAYNALRNRRRFAQELKKGLKRGKVPRRIALAVSIALLAISILVPYATAKLVAAGAAVIIMLSSYLWILSSVVERACMLEWVSPRRLTEGDWIEKDVFAGGRRIAGPGDLGVSKAQIGKLVRLHREKKIGKVLLKKGSPLVPAFLLALLASHFLGNLFVFLLAGF